MNIICNKYKLLEKLGQGNFGFIFKGENIRTKELVAIKIEPIKNNTKLLIHESKIYQYLYNIKNIPSVKWFYKDSINYYMAIQLLGDSLETMKQKKYKLSLSDVLKIGVQLVELIEKIHSKGLVHRDIKPDNFLYGLGNNSEQLYIIDFGFCKNYLINNLHIKQKKIHNIIGTPKFISIHTHDYIELSRRDDLESIGYLLLYLYFGYLEWDNIIYSFYNQEINENIKKKKIEFLNENINIPKPINKYFFHIKNLLFEERPNYNLCIDMFTSYII